VATVHVPALLRHLTGGAESLHLTLPAGERITLRALLERLSADHPGLMDGLLYQGDLMPGIAVIVDNDQSLMGLLTKVEDSSEIRFVPPIVGG